ncbi:zinc ribbon domain-containing protein [Paenibacillus sp. NPDC057967]|uniref:zinc ribbon domain-containing protein n=1 Tax=Paenibacillus sp. NPDC057967 TaxID=3346293 RepID=UPI0036D8C629
MEEVNCPWCGEQVILDSTICPLCKHEVLPEHLSGKESSAVAEEGLQDELEEEATASQLMNNYTCARCGHEECNVQEVAMTGTGISKLLDIQHHHYFFVSCLQCGKVDVYDPNVLEARKRGLLGTGMDLFL